MLPKAGIMQHPVGIAANRKNLAGLKYMLFIQRERLRVMLNAALIDHGLAMVFAVTFQSW